MCRILTRIRRSIMIVSRRLILCCLFLLTVATQPAHALDPTRRISQYGHTAWRLRDGFLGARPRRLRRPRMVTSGSGLSRGWCASTACALFRGRRPPASSCRLPPSGVFWLRVTEASGSGQRLV